ncbi:MAG: aminoglycoside phosphotransferase family protein [Burkholderiaceae bacterium]|nr:aminoglycoside phosphotransferase family protein [Burkholderiaceae bacterium]
MPSPDVTAIAPSTPDAPDAVTRLAAALQLHGGPWHHAVLEPLRDKGLAHDHIRLAGTGALARLPKQSQLGLPAQDNLAYQAACFERAAASGHTPRLLGVLPPGDALPRGGLLVEEIIGLPARLPQDLPAIMRALASVHRLALPAAALRPPLMDAPDPLAALLADIEAQAQHLDAARLGAPVRSVIGAGIAQLRKLCTQAPRPARKLISFDAHPGNFLIRTDGEAVLVDLEKCRYSYPGLDLAHATLYTSTTWDVDAAADLALDEVIAAYAVWDAASAAPSGEASLATSSWHLPLRRAMWLWSLTWCAKWRAVSGQQPSASADGEDWSAGRSEASLIAHVRGRVDHYLSLAGVAHVMREFDALEAAWRR